MKTPNFNIYAATFLASLLTSTQIFAAQPQPAPNGLTTDQQKVSYAIGIKTAQELKQYDLDTMAYLDGYKDGATAAPFKLSDQDMEAVLMKFQEQVRAKHEAEHKEMAKKMKEAGVNNLTEGAKFLSNNKMQPGVQVTPSGLQYKIIKAGNGPKPKLGNYVVVNYKGMTIDGKEFDSSYKRKASATFKLEKGDLIDGWVEALQLMPVGSTWQITVPASLGYGEHGMPPVIEPNAVLIFEIELITIK